MPNLRIKSFINGYILFCHGKRKLSEESYITEPKMLKNLVKISSILSKDFTNFFSKETGDAYFFIRLSMKFWHFAHFLGLE